MHGHKKRILVVDDEPEITSLLAETLESNGYEVDCAGDAKDAKEQLLKSNYLMVLADINLPTESGLKILEFCSKRLNETPPFLFITGMNDPAVIAAASKLGAVDVIEKPFEIRQVLAAVKFMEERGSDKITDLMAMMSRISGITLGRDKRFLVETRLLRRTRQLGLSGIDEYLNYFSLNRHEEVAQIIAVVTTHTTQFFREHQHFDFLIDQGFDSLLMSDKNILNVWSAASSTGEELYSLAMCWHEFVAQSKNQELEYKFRGLGTDIDQASIAKASKGIYPKSGISRLSQGLIKKYFVTGSGSLAAFVKVCDKIYNKCQFRNYNLISPHSIEGQFDIIFLRNVLIYFSGDKVQKIIENVSKNLNPGGLLFLGYSESLNMVKHDFLNIGHAIYQKRNGRNKRVLIDLKDSSLVATSSRNSRIRVYIVDDSATVRGVLKKILNADPNFEVVGEAENPHAIGRMITKAEVDVMTLDLHMPEQDGISYLKSISHKEHPAVVVISSVSEKDGVDVMHCLELGATDYIEKPTSVGTTLSESHLKDVIKAASKQKFKKSNSVKRASILPNYIYNPDDLFLIGASTGGVEAVKCLLQGFPQNSPPILIVQHIPRKFSQTFAKRLSQTCPIKVTEAQDGDVLEPSHAYIAPGGMQMGVREVGKNHILELTDEAPINRHKPSVDFLFKSVAATCRGKRIVAALLTGMGEDGARGLLDLKKIGAHTIAQDEESCVVYGMPKAAVELKAVSEELPLESITFHLFDGLKKIKNAA